MFHQRPRHCVTASIFVVLLSWQLAVLDAANFTSLRANSESCSIGGMVLPHRSLHYYQDKLYVSCLHGQSACFQTGHTHTQAVSVTCPAAGLEAQIDAYEAMDTLVSRRRLQQRHLSLAVKAEGRLWDGGVVCYNLNTSYPFNETERQLIGTAMQHYEQHTNVRFLPVTKCRADAKFSTLCGGCANYLDYKHPTTGRDCNSSIGVTSTGPLVMNLAQRCFEGDELKATYGSAMHEIGHSLGLYHEHQHPQRSIAIFWDDLPQSLWGEMKRRTDVIGGEYDLDSVMHYPADGYNFCVPRYCSDTVKTDCVNQGAKFCYLNDDEANCVTPTDKMCDDAATAKVGQRTHLSADDLAALGALYPTASWPETPTMIS